MPLDMERYYIESLNDLREACGPIIISVIIFIAGLSIGMMYPERFSEIRSSFERITEQYAGREISALIVFIFSRNSLAAAIPIVLGAVLGVAPFMGAITNGLLVGIMLYDVIALKAFGAALLLIPHGIFELPALFMAWGLGLWQGAWFLERDKRGALKERTYKSLRIYFLIIVPLLIIAAVIEGIGMGIMEI
jgi:uncharacterized membrane protein SpoIIM required for sporulation